MSDKKPVPPSLAQFALEQLAEAGEQAAIDLTVQNVEILRAEIEKRDARIAELEAALSHAHMALVGYLPGHRNAITDAAIESASAAMRIKN